MNRNLHSLLTSLLVFLTLGLSAQVDLPYYTGFDDASERAGWRIYRTGENALANWAIGTVGGFSPTSAINHDYAPSTGATLADDWYVSPGFLLPEGGTLDSVRYYFSGFSVPADDDTIGIFLLTGSQDPEAASSITLLADFRGDEYVADATYRLLNEIALAPTPDSAFIAIRYRNAEVSSRWLTVRFDNIAISSQTTAVDPPLQGLIMSLYPNPANDVVNIVHADEAGVIVMRDYRGRVIQQMKIATGQTMTSIFVGNLAGGFYCATLLQGGRESSAVFMKE